MRRLKRAHGESKLLSVSTEASERNRSESAGEQVRARKRRRIVEESEIWMKRRTNGTFLTFRVIENEVRLPA
jgi:Holliday junction resolvase-like predicted endonuclease